MSLELADWEGLDPAAGVVYREVLDTADLQAYHELTVGYWEVSEE
jgi:hypothetical protein